MASISVTTLDVNLFEVYVADKHPTSHQVTVSVDYAQTLTQGTHSTEALVEAAFAFLLEREPNTSILRQFDLKVIERYFPEFPCTIQRYLLA